MSEWKPGWVVNMHGQLVKIEKGQMWGYLNYGVEGGITITEGEFPPNTVLPLTVISTSACGEVVLRCPKPELVDAMFPLKETTFKGKSTMSREGCPFMYVEERVARGSKGELQTGDLLANEAWDVWRCMHNRQSLKPGDLPFRVEKP